jgi:hypothetical protein
LSSRGSIWLYVLLGAFLAGGVSWWARSSLRQSAREHAAVIDKQPVTFTRRTFDPLNPPSEMPPLAYGEEAECDSNFLSNASVGGETQQTDATHAFVTITQIKMTLELNVTIWAPANVSPHVMEHEEGHRQISGHYYETADKVAERVAAKYMGEKIEVTGADLSAESSKFLQQAATEITEEYKRELNPGAAQLLYDSITDHGRNEVVVKDAVASAIKNVVAESAQPAANPGN